MNCDAKKEKLKKASVAGTLGDGCFLFG